MFLSLNCLGEARTEATIVYVAFSRNNGNRDVFVASVSGLCIGVWRSDNGALFNLLYTYSTVGEEGEAEMQRCGGCSFLFSSLRSPLFFSSPLCFLSQLWLLLKTDNRNWRFIFALLSVRFRSVCSPLMDVPYESCPVRV